GRAPMGCFSARRRWFQAWAIFWAQETWSQVTWAWAWVTWAPILTHQQPWARPWRLRASWPQAFWQRAFWEPPWWLFPLPALPRLRPSCAQELWPSLWCQPLPPASEALPWGQLHWRTRPPPAHLALL